MARHYGLPFNPETPPSHWTDEVELDQCANVEWSECVWFGVIAFAVTVAGFVLWIVGNVVMSVIVPW